MSLHAESFVSFVVCVQSRVHRLDYGRLHLHVINLPPTASLPPWLNPHVPSYITEGRLRAMVALSVGGMAVLLAFEAACPPPEALPYLHPTLNALFSCANLTVAYGLCVFWQWREGDCYGVEFGGGSRAAELKKTR